MWSFLADGSFGEAIHILGMGYAHLRKYAGLLATALEIHGIQELIVSLVAHLHLLGKWISKDIERDDLSSEIL